MLKSICNLFPFPHPPAATSAEMIEADWPEGDSADTSMFQGFGASKSPASVVVVVPPPGVVVVVVPEPGSHWQSTHGVLEHGAPSSQVSPLTGSRWPSPQRESAAANTTGRRCCTLTRPVAVVQVAS